MSIHHFLAGAAIVGSLLFLGAGPVGQPDIPNNAALKALAAGQFKHIHRAGFATFGDGGAADYYWSAVNCSLNFGAGDNGSQVKPNIGTGCWLLDAQYPLRIEIWGLTTPIFYVRKAGASDHSGDNFCLVLVDPCASIGQALIQHHKFPWYNSNQRIDVGAGTWDESVTANQPIIPYRGYVGTVIPQLYLKGAGSASTTLTGDGLQCGTVISNTGALVAVEGMTITATRIPCQSGLYANLGGEINVWPDIKFGAANQMHMIVEENNSFIGIWADYTIAGNATYHMGVTTGGHIFMYPANVLDANGVNVILSGTPTFSSFVLAQHRGHVLFGADTTFTGSATGSQYFVESFGSIISNNTSSPPIPGNNRGVNVADGLIFPESRLAATLNSVGSLTGLGTGTATVTQTSSSDFFVVLSPTGAPAATGSFVVNLSSIRRFSDGNAIPCNVDLAPNSANWDTGATKQISSGSNLSTPNVSITWKNGAAALTAGQTYALGIRCR